MFKKIKLVYINIVISFIFIQTVSSQNTEQIYKLNKVFNIISTHYVDSVEENKIVEKAILAMLKNLDPHSSYYSKEIVKRINESLQGNFEGIGINFNVLNDTIFVISPIKNGPSEKSGILSGDRIISIEGKNVAGIGIKSQNVRKYLLGKKGTAVKITVKRKAEKKYRNFVIIRDKISINSVDISYMVNSSTGYIKLNQFSATTLPEFRKAINRLKIKGLKNLILDLRENSGGYLYSAIELVDEFLPQKKLILYTEGANSPRSEYKANLVGTFEKGKLIVMIDEGSASASEIVAGSLQDWDRAIIIGRRSYGKGLVQRPFYLLDGSMIRLTIARYYTPTGRLIQKPYKKGFVDYRNDIIYRYKKGEFFYLDSIKLPDSLKYRTLVNKRVVYGGGGIMPDVFIPIDTTNVSEYYRQLIKSGIVNKFLLSYEDENRSFLKKNYPNFTLFNQYFKVNDKILKNLVSFAETEEINRKISYNDYLIKNFKGSKNIIKTQLKALIARDMWTIGEYYRIMNSVNSSFIKAVEILNNDVL